jgi:hypothetical protein
VDCAETLSRPSIWFINDFYLLKNFSFATPKRKVTKEKGVSPAKKHPVSVAGGARPCAPGLDYPLL